MRVIRLMDSPTFDKLVVVDFILESEENDYFC